MPDRIGGVLRAEVEITIADGWHIQSASPDLAHLTATSLQVSSRDSIADLSLTYPESIGLRFGDASLDAYAGVVRIALTCRIAPRESSRAHLTFTVTYQACDDSRCLQPETISLPLEIDF